MKTETDLTQKRGGAELTQLPRVKNYEKNFSPKNLIS